jgi:hypothetical protein
MSTVESEAQLARPVLEFLKALGCDKLQTEVALVDRDVDVFAIRSGRQGRSYAVELKLHDWRKALRQAAIYQLCADYCYVAMPNQTADRIERKGFRQAGVGLLSVDFGSNKVRVVCAARRSPIKRAVYFECLQKSLDANA